MRSRITEYAKYESLSTAFLTVERDTRDWCSLPSPLSRRHSPSVCPAVTGPNIGTRGVSHSCFTPEITWCSWADFARVETKLWLFMPDLSPTRQLQLTAGRAEFWANGRAHTAAVWNKRPVSACLPLVRACHRSHTFANYFV